MLFCLSFKTLVVFSYMLQDKEYNRDLPHKVAKQLDAEYWETSSKSGTPLVLLCARVCVCKLMDIMNI